MGFWVCSNTSWTICRQSATRSRWITTPTARRSTFTGWMLFNFQDQVVSRRLETKIKTRELQHRIVAAIRTSTHAAVNRNSYNAVRQPGIPTVTCRDGKYDLPSHTYIRQLVAWHSGKTSVSDWRTFLVLRSTCS